MVIYRLFSNFVAPVYHISPQIATSFSRFLKKAGQKPTFLERKVGKRTFLKKRHIFSKAIVLLL